MSRLAKDTAWPPAEARAGVRRGLRGGARRVGTRPTTVVAGAFAVALLAGACTSGSSGSSATTVAPTTTMSASASAVCTQWKALAAALTKLTTVPPDLQARNVAGAKATIAAVETQVEALAGVAEATLTPALTQLKAAAASAKAEVDKITGGKPTLQQIGAVGAALVKVGSTASTVSSQVGLLHCS